MLPKRGTVPLSIIVARVWVTSELRYNFGQSVLPMPKPAPSHVRGKVRIAIIGIAPRDDFVEGLLL